MLFNLKSPLQEMDLGLIGNEYVSNSQPYTLYDWLNEVDEEEDDYEIFK